MAGKIVKCVWPLKSDSSPKQLENRFTQETLFAIVVDVCHCTKVKIRRHLPLVGLPRAVVFQTCKVSWKVIYRWHDFARHQKHNLQTWNTYSALNIPVERMNTNHCSKEITLSYFSKIMEYSRYEWNEAIVFYLDPPLGKIFHLIKLHLLMHLDFTHVKFV